MVTDRGGAAVRGWAAVRSWLRTLAVVAAVGGCRSISPPSIETAVVVDTLHGAADRELLQPIDVAVTDEGTVFIADMGTDEVVLLDSTGAVLRRIGRTGSGPGEFRAPRSLHLARDTVRLIDAANGRVVVMATDGTGWRTMPVVPGIGSVLTSFGDEGELLVATGGREGGLARRFTARGEPGGVIGRARVPVLEAWDFQAIEQDLDNRRIPDQLRNATIPVLGPDGSAWLVLSVDGGVERWAVSDSLEWSIALPDARLEPIRQELFELNRRDSTAGSFVFPTVVADARAVGTELWILLRQPDGEPAVIVRIGVDGTMHDDIVIRGAEGARRFAVFPDGRAIVLITPSTSTVVKATFKFQEGK